MKPTAGTPDNLFPHIREVSSPMSREMLRRLDPKCRIVQFSRLLTDKDFKRLGKFMSDYPSVTLRAYGSYDRSIRNLDFLQHFPTLKRFSADALWDQLENVTGLEYLPEDIDSLTLGALKKPLQLDPLRHFTSLRHLHLEGPVRNFDVVSELVTLESLALRSITLPDLSPLVPLRRIKALELRLGGTHNISLLPEIGQLEYLELWMIRGMADITPISSVTSLKALFVQALKRVTELPSMNSLHELESVHIETMKGLTDVSPLATAPTLRNLWLIDMPQLKIDSLNALVGHPTLAAAVVGTGSKRRNDEAEKLLQLPRPSLGARLGSPYWA